MLDVLQLSLPPFFCTQWMVDCFFYYLAVLPSLFTTFFFFNDTATTEIYTLSLHDALPIYRAPVPHDDGPVGLLGHFPRLDRSEEHTSELQSHSDLVCRLLLEKKKKSQVRA